VSGREQRSGSRAQTAAGGGRGGGAAERRRWNPTLLWT